MAPEAVHDLNHLLVVAPDQHPIGLGLHPSGQHRRIDQIGEQDRQPPDLTSVTRGGEQILGLGVAPIDREHLIGQRRRCHPIATVNRRHRSSS